jgi:hypothetical protein
MYKKASEKIENTLHVDQLIGFPPYNTKTSLSYKISPPEENVHIHIRIKAHSSLSLADNTKAMRTTS